MVNTSRQYKIFIKPGESLSIPVATNALELSRRNMAPAAAFTECYRRPEDKPEVKLPCGPYLTYNAEKISFEVDGSTTAGNSESWMKYDYTLKLDNYEPTRQSYYIFLQLTILDP
jgi:hypothetical protein